jgi:GntR family transcriptional regulator
MAGKARTSKSSGKGARPVAARQPLPLYHQIYLALRDQIANGNYAQDDFLPTEQELIRQYGVSRITAKRALDELKMDGLVERSRGRGTRVQAANRVPAVRAPIEGLVENILAMGLKTEVDLLEFDYVPANRDVAAALACAIGDTVQRAVRVRRLDGEPFSHLVTHVPEAIGRSFTRRELATRPLLLLLERSGAAVSHAEQVLTATLASGSVAELLNVPTGAALLQITRTVYDQNERPVEHIVGSYRPDRYQYSMTLSRSSSGAHALWSPGDDRAPSPAWDN